MSVETAGVGEGLRQAVPFVRTLDLQFLEVTPGRARVRLPDRADLHNHVAGPHAGALFTLGESASGAVVLAAFGDLLGEATPLAVSAEIEYQRLARGPVTAEAVLTRPADAVRAELAAGERPEFTVEVVFRPDDAAAAGDYRPSGRMSVRWTLRPNR